MKKINSAALVLPAFLLLIFLFAACTPRDTGTGTTAATDASTAAHSTNRETTASASQTGESSQTATSAASGTTDTTGTTAAARTTQPAAATTAQTPPTTNAAAVYDEWTYRNGFGNTVTYTENPDHPYIRLVSRQTGISPDRLSASFWSQGAAVFVFRSADRNTDTLNTAYFILAKDMEVFTLNGTAAQSEFSKFSRQTAVALYSMALEHRP